MTFSGPFRLRASLYLLLVLGARASEANAGLISPVDIHANWIRDGEIDQGINNDFYLLDSLNRIATGNTYGTLISDFSVAGDFSFSTTVEPVDDNDIFGIVFGWQDVQNTYALTWGGGGGLNPSSGISFRKLVGGGNTVLDSSADLWVAGTSYQLTASRSGSLLSVSIASGSTTIFSSSVNDTTFLSGSVGFNVWSQRTLWTETSIMPEPNPVPEPSSIALLGMGVAGLGSYRMRRDRQTAV